MNRILVPTDFSSSAENALKIAAQIARKNNCEILLVHMLELPHQASDSVAHGREIPEIMFFKNAVTNRLGELASSDFLEGLKVIDLIQIAFVNDGISSLTDEYEVDLIVMGSHGASGFKEMFVGSNAEKVVRNSSVPVLVIKSENENFEVNNFVFASDFSEEIKKPFEKLLNLASLFNSKLHLVTINTPDQFMTTHEAEDKMNNFISQFKISNYNSYIYNDVNIEKGILNFAKRVNADLIGMSTHGRKGLSHFFNGSRSEDLVNHAKLPVVTFKI